MNDTHLLPLVDPGGGGVPTRFFWLSFILFYPSFFFLFFSINLSIWSIIGTFITLVPQDSAHLPPCHIGPPPKFFSRYALDFFSIISPTKLVIIKHGPTAILVSNTYIIFHQKTLVNILNWCFMILFENTYWDLKFNLKEKWKFSVIRKNLHLLTEKKLLQSFSKQYIDVRHYSDAKIILRYI